MQKRLTPLYFLLVFCLLLGHTAFALAASVPFTSTMAVTSVDEENCKRVLAGNSDLVWPLNQNYYDVVIIQDASGSFTQTMPQVKETLKQMFGSLDLGLTANGYPKDRAMLVTYQGSTGFGITRENGDIEYQYYDWFGYKLTNTPLTTDLTVLNAAVDAISPLGATPTIDGLALAEKIYTESLGSTNPYDSAYYLEDNIETHRDTIYFLITDGVANSGKMSNFPPGTEPIPTDNTAHLDRGYTWVYEDKARTYFERYWNDENTTVSTYTYTNADGIQVPYRTFTDENGKTWYIKNPAEPTSLLPFFMYELVSGPDGPVVDFSAYTYDPWEDYVRMMGSVVAKAAEMKATGGVPEQMGGQLSDATFVSAYWEDIKRFIAGNLNGITYRPYVQPVVQTAMKEMASQDNYFISHNEGADFAEFQTNLLEGLRLVTNIDGTVTFKLASYATFVEPEFKVYHVVDGAEREVNPPVSFDAASQTVTITMDDLPKGHYRYEYVINEDPSPSNTYYPVTNVTVTAEKSGNLAIDIASGLLASVAGYNLESCVPYTPEEQPTPTPTPEIPDRGFLIPVTGHPMVGVKVPPVQEKVEASDSAALVLEIPRLNKKVEITGVPHVNGEWDIGWLNNQVGYLYGTAYPTWSGNTVLTAHVWNAYNQPGPFFGLKEMKYGEKIFIHAFGKTYEYSVQTNERISSTDIDKVMVTEQKDWVTLLTCETYDEKNQTYAARRIVRAVLTAVN